MWKKYRIYCIWKKSITPSTTSKLIEQGKNTFFPEVNVTVLQRLPQFCISRIASFSCFRLLWPMVEIPTPVGGDSSSQYLWRVFEHSRWLPGFQPSIRHPWFVSSPMIHKMPTLPPEVSFASGGVLQPQRTRSSRVALFQLPEEEINEQKNANKTYIQHTWLEMHL